MEPDLVPTERFIAFTPPFPSLAVDRDDGGRVYASFQDGRLGDADVWLWASEDEGAASAGHVGSTTPSAETAPLNICRSSPWRRTGV